MPGHLRNSSNKSPLLFDTSRMFFFKQNPALEIAFISIEFPTTNNFMWKNYAYKFHVQPSQTKLTLTQRPKTQTAVYIYEFNT